jgi:hypothetical protein
MMPSPDEKPGDPARGADQIDVAIASCPKPRVSLAGGPLMRDFLFGVVWTGRPRPPLASPMSKSTRPILGRPRHHRLARLVITDIDLNPQGRRHDLCDGATAIKPDIPIEQAIPDARQRE